MSELAGRIVSVRDVLPKEHRSLTERLQELPSWEARFELVERVLSERIAAFSFATISLGVFAGAKAPYQVEVLNPGSPLSFNVGMSETSA